MKFVIDSNIPRLAEIIRTHRPEIEVVTLPAAQITPDAVRDADALIVRTRTACNEALLKGSAVKFVGTATIGMDHIDADFCSREGIAVANAPGCNAPAVMQYVAAALLSAGFDPQSHTLGVVGKGNIGSLVTDLFRRAGTRVLVCDPPRADRGEDDEAYLSLPELLAQADAVTLHVPLSLPGEATYPTFNLLNAGNAGLLKPGAVVVNASRGSVVEESVIRSGADSLRLIIDTWPFEEGGSSDAREEMIRRSFIATPHIAGYSLSGKLRATAAMIHRLNEFFGLDIPDVGLPDYSFKTTPYDLETVAASYDILADSEALKAVPGQFEALRNGYKLRE
ncbi:MAG: 4-phosphoerythronate dehydrogenase [Muribaculaceae bacterium]|nr:4-phosphoerythronate dehydrogenase [Muribaculaceae bacterium]